MKRILVLSVLALTVFGGVASADRDRGRWRDRDRHHDRGDRHRGDHDRGSWRGNWRGGWSGGVRVTGPRVVVQPRRVYVQHTRVVRRPIFVQAPRLRVRYYNYYQQPAVLAENYAAMPGYYWVAGQWSWTGYEWQWTAGHYEPDPNYVEPGYSDYGDHYHDDHCGHGY